ncbi:MAG: glycosyltransferase family 4 protein [Deltaproteobacteria bacterium]|nr:glycosyltransferase family 4 protein [Deltaproteobacteria bacterium]
MKILVVVSYYRPDGGAGATLFPLLCEELVKMDHEVTVLTTVPHYPSGRVLNAYRGRKNRFSKENGVKIVRVGLPSVDRSKLKARLFQFVVFQMRATCAGLLRDCDVLLTHTPALEVWLPFLYFSSFRRKAVLYTVADIYPEVGVNLGIFRNKFLIRAVGWLENYCLKRADKVRILSRSFESILANKGVSPSKLALIYDWVDIESVRPLPKMNRFAIENGLDNRFVVLYAGNIGPVQGLASILEAASLINNDSEVRFVFVGDGAARNTLMERTTQIGLDNVRFIPYQPRERMAEVFAAADISLVSLRKGASFGALPSKIYQILASGRPVIASVDEESDMWDLIKRAEAGFCVPPEDPSKLAEAILTLKRDKDLRERLGRNGRIWAEKHHSVRAAAEKFETLLLEVISSKKT